MTTTKPETSRTQGQIESTLVATLKAMAIRKGRGMLGAGWGESSVRSSLLTSKVASLHEGKAKMQLIRMGYDPYVARRIIEDCSEVAANEAAIELGI